jgi:futalosine hydrolase
MSRVLLVTAVSTEADAVCAGMMGTWQPRATVAATPSARGGPAPSWDRQLLTAVRFGPYLGRRSGSVTVLAAGVAGPAAAAGTATALATARAAGDPFSLVISLGIAGGFRNQADIGDLVVANTLIAADLGAESGSDTSSCDISSARPRLEEPPPRGPASDARPDPGAGAGSTTGGFLSLDHLGLGPSAMIPQEEIVQRLVSLLAGTGRTIRTGPVLSVSTITGTAQRAAMLTRRFGPTAEAMEGYAVGVAATAFDTPFAEIRVISNAVGHRDRSTWDVAGALAGLSATAAGLAVGIDTLTAVPRPAGNTASAGSAGPAPEAGTR